ncbi:MAG: hypothetical protein IJR35_06605 [Synergistaceae bacterium]|nr:hypothetical protein [Synergistaceae bacterium]
MGIDTGRIDRAQTGQEFYDAVENSLAEYTRKNDIQDSINRSDKRASLFLNKFGIPGLRYLDDGSRNKGKGTSNYVIWDADSLKLMGLTEDSGQDAKDYFTRTQGESYNQIIGETGSGRLDNFEGNAQRRANLDLAKHMERNGNSASEIWAMTGWMRGAEGKWRYEIPDGKFNKQGLLKLARISRELFALDDKTIKDPNYVFTSAEQKEHDRLVDLFSNATLGDIYNAPELFKAYPDIAGIHVIIDEFKGADKNSIAFYNHNDNYIAFNVKYLGKDSDEIRAVLIHEIQHAMQIREGFAGGGNPDEMLSIAENGKIDINPFLRRNYAREERAMYEALPKELREKFKKLREIEKTASKKEFLDNLFKTLSQNETIRYSKWRNLQELVRSITSNKKLITSDEAYWALAGEVEARNAEERSYMNKRERRNTPLDKTEDERYPRERQIVVDSFGNPYSREGLESYNQSLNLPFSPDELTTESGRPIDEAGLSEMLLTPDGSRTLGNIDSKTARIAGILPGTIQANVGVLRHAERQHGKQIINAGYSDVKTFMLHVLNNWSEIREGSNNSLWLVMPKDEGHAGVSAIQLHQDEENVYRVSTLLFARNRSLKNRRLLFAGRPSPAASSGSDMNLTRAPYDFSGRNTAKGVLSEKQSPEESLNSNVLDVNNNGFITPDKLERYNQDSLHGTGHIILDNQHQLKYSGSGEGSAAYGYGIYSTQNRAIAEHYRRYGLTGSTHTNEHSESNRGNIYKLDVPEDNEILNWDAKLSEQPEQIMPAIREAVDMLNNHPEKGIAAIFAPRLKRGKTASLERIIKSLTAKFKGHYIGFYEQRDLPEFEAIRKLFYAKDKNAVDDLLDVINKIVFAKKFDEKTATGEKLYWALTDLLGSDINASMYLNSLGIPGHRYLGGMSKAKGESTYNYVTWNEDRVKVLGLTEDSDDDAKEYFRRTKEKLEQANPDMITPENLGENNELVSDAIIERYNQAMLHGTGHIVLGNRFDLSKIGTGETHQAFGWGAYLAQAMGVAETYRKYGTKLASPEFNINVKTKDGKTYSLSSRSRHSTTYAWRGKPDNYLKRVLERLGDEIRVSHNISLDEAKSRVAKEINAELERWRSNFYINVDKDTIQDNIEDNEKCLEALETINSFDVEEKEGRYGNIYRFDGPENDVLLDYDETLDNQPEHVKKAIEKIRRFVKWCGQNKYISINFILRGEFFEE